MGIDWYNAIALRNGGYRTNAVYTIEGRSAEAIFEQELIELLPHFESVLDAGCGHGDFTFRMARFAHSIIGFDFAAEMIKIAQAALQDKPTNNLDFVRATTKSELPFSDEQFDLIYDRRGPTSIIKHSRILRSGGMIFGIHSGALDLVKERLQANPFTDIEIRVFDEAKIYFPNKLEFTKFISDIPGNPDYTEVEYKDELEEKINKHTINGRLQITDYKYIWKAIKA